METAKWGRKRRYRREKYEQQTRAAPSETCSRSRSYGTDRCNSEVCLFGEAMSKVLL